MAQRYLFFNSINDDRRIYQAQDFADYFGSVLSTGLLHEDNVPGLEVSVETGTMNTVVDAGSAIMRGHLYINDTPHTLTHSLAEPTADRIDRVILRLDLRNAHRNILLHVKEGVPSANPEPPDLQRDNFIYELSLAQVRIRANTSTIDPSDVTDERFDDDVCGLVFSLLGNSYLDSRLTQLEQTSEIVESGENANGHYVKWANGLMICWGQIEATDVTATTQRAFGGYRSTGIPVPFPATFHTSGGVPKVSSYFSVVDLEGKLTYGSTNYSSAQFVVHTINQVTSPIPLLVIGYTAVGRWKDYD